MSWLGLVRTADCLSSAVCCSSALRQAESGATQVIEICRNIGITETTFYPSEQSAENEAETFRAHTASA